MGIAGHARRAWRWPAAKLLLLALYLAFDHAAITARIASLGPAPALLAWAGLYVLLALALAAAAFMPGHRTRILVAAAMAAGSVMLHSYEWATGSPLTYNAFETMVASRGDAGDAMSQHATILFRSVAAAAVLFVALALPPGRAAMRHGLGWILPAGALLLLAALLYLRGGEGARALPAPFSPLAQLGIMAALELTDDDGPRRAVEQAPGPPAASGDIVLVVDESVAANYLDINHPNGVHSGLAASRLGLGIHNFGIAASATNCSAGSNAVLRFGGTRETYRRAARREPSIWAYARQAGFRTVYLDGQRNDGALQNLMTKEERAEIDDFMQLGATPVPERDHRLAALLAERLGNGVREFILINKVGAHFPVADKFPEDAARYTPLPPRGRMASIIDIAADVGGHTGTAGEWRLYRNAYRNTIAWNTGGFFDRLLPHMPGTGAVLIYTADHGQDLHEDGRTGKSTHCMDDTRPEEGAVPLVVIDAADAGALPWQEGVAHHRNATSHFRVFPTLLALLGYDPEPLYGPTLVDAEPDPMTFTSNYFAALGREPHWHKIEPGRLASPPRSDFAADAVRKAP